MNSLSIDELAGSVGLTRRAVRFYVQAKLLPPPLSRGRAARYTIDHQNRLRRIIELQSAGHSLDEIRQIFAGGSLPAPPTGRRGVRAAFDAALMTRIVLADGVELHFDAARYSPAVSDLLEIRKAAHRAFNVSNSGNVSEKNQP